MQEKQELSISVTSPSPNSIKEMVQKRALLNCVMTRISKEQTISIQNYCKKKKKKENADWIISANETISQKIDRETEKLVTLHTESFVFKPAWRM